MLKGIQLFGAVPMLDPGAVLPNAKDRWHESPSDGNPHWSRQFVYVSSAGGILSARMGRDDQLVLQLQRGQDDYTLQIRRDGSWIDSHFVSVATGDRVTFHQRHSPGSARRAILAERAAFAELPIGREDQIGIVERLAAT